MSRFPTHAVEDAPEASRPLLEKIAQSSPTGRPLNAHAQMAHSPAVLAAYTSLPVHSARLPGSASLPSPVMASQGNPDQDEVPDWLSLRVKWNGHGGGA